MPTSITSLSSVLRKKEEVKWVIGHDEGCVWLCANNMRGGRQRWKVDIEGKA
jgi:hypothetical protein